MNATALQQTVSLDIGHSVSESSSLNPSSGLGYIRSFLQGRSGREFYLECLGLMETYGELDLDQPLIDRTAKDVSREIRVLEKLIALAESQGFQFGLASEVLANGYPGVIVRLYDGDEQLDGMVGVKLASGEIILPRYELEVR